MFGRNTVPVGSVSSPGPGGGVAEGGRVQVPGRPLSRVASVGGFTAPRPGLSLVRTKSVEPLMGSC